MAARQRSLLKCLLDMRVFCCATHSAWPYIFIFKYQMRPSTNIPMHTYPYAVGNTHVIISHFIYAYDLLGHLLISYRFCVHLYFAASQLNWALFQQSGGWLVVNVRATPFPRASSHHARWNCALRCRSVFVCVGIMQDSMWSMRRGVCPLANNCCELPSSGFLYVPCYVFVYTFVGLCLLCGLIVNFAFCRKAKLLEKSKKKILLMYAKVCVGTAIALNCCQLVNASMRQVWVSWPISTQDYENLLNFCLSACIHLLSICSELAQN